jgi:hypothetical protein
MTALWRIKLSDWERALIVAIVAAPIGLLYDWATQATFVLSWQALVKGAVAGGLGYIIKNLLTGINGNILTNK